MRTAKSKIKTILNNPWMTNFTFPVTPVASDGIEVEMSYREYKELVNMGYDFNVDCSKDIQKALIILRL